METRSIVIIGAAGTGKTSWARKHVPKPALFVTHMDVLKQLTARHKAIVFDDMSFKHLPREGQIAIVDREQPRAN